MFACEKKKLITNVYLYPQRLWSSKLSFNTIIDRIMAPKNVHILIPGTYEYVNFCGKGNFTDISKDLEMNYAVSPI